MEWQSINLSGYHERKWLKNAIFNLAWLAFVIIVSGCLAALIWRENQRLNKDYQNQSKSISKSEKALIGLDKNIAELKNTKQQPKPIYLSKNQVAQFIQYLNELSIKGFIQSIHFYRDNVAEIKVNGKLAKETDLNTITQQLKQKNYIYKLEYFQKNEQQQFEFSLLITLDNQENNQ